MQIRPVEPGDTEEWLRLRLALFPDGEPAEHRAEMALLAAQPDAIVLVAVRPDTGGLAGFAEVGARPYADGCATSPVAFLEGWYVDADVRRQGVGGALVRAAEEWARARGYREFASDALLDNVTSHRAHEALGFTEVERAVRYRKAL
ncbi:MAG TPA: aminoglycoside 6'-N-acetyltransferase [Gemmatimonadales bacterium]|nr:aminoglycoside 6'-N-acetyltransferase [Gemmatimonadales bacterium]